jgi:polysaccharide pyruvyl transferase WcaK-like protein
LITVREPETERYLAGLGIAGNVRPVADPAFLMAPIEPDGRVAELLPAGRRLLGINLSPLSATHLWPGAPLGSRVRAQAAILRQLAISRGYTLVLVPHVVIPEEPADDDYAYLHRIRTALRETGFSDVVLLPPDLGAQCTKALLTRLDALVTARMHCGIAAVSAGVPTLFLAYSRKAQGMAEFVYGNAARCIPLADMNTIIAHPLFEELPVVRETLRQKRDQWQAQAMAAGEGLRASLHMHGAGVCRAVQTCPNDTRRNA